MRIVNKKTFLAMQGEVLYCEYRPQYFEELRIKTSNVGSNDFVFSSLVEIQNDSSNDLFYKFTRMEEDTSLDLPLDTGFTGRDGTFDDSCLYAVFNTKDISQIIDRLSLVLKARLAELEEK